MDSVLMHDFILVLSEVANVQHAPDFKVLSSFLVFITSFAAGNIILYDFFRGQKRKIAGSIWHSVLITMGFSQYAVALFGVVRFLDGIEDSAFLVENPDAVTTLSQQTLTLELPFFLVALTTFIFIIFYLKAYIKIPSHYYEEKD